MKNKALITQTIKKAMAIIILISRILNGYNITGIKMVCLKIDDSGKGRQWAIYFPLSAKA
jgi:hypothetical protein